MIVAVAVVAIAMSFARLRRFVREKVWPQVMSAVHNIWGILTTPRQLGLIVGGSVAAQLLLLALPALMPPRMGQPVAGRDRVREHLGVVPRQPGAGAGRYRCRRGGDGRGLTAFGIPPELATATVITHRLFTTYLPPIWGNYATKRLISDGYL
jgi:hypothetical protein